MYIQKAIVHNAHCTYRFKVQSRVCIFRGYIPTNRRKPKNGVDMFEQTSKIGKCARTINAISSSHIENIALLTK